MPAGVDVCQCSFEGPSGKYINVETQLYDDEDEAGRVFNMYCSDELESAGIGTYSCIAPKTSSTRPAYVYFLDNSHFVKVSCLGACSLDSLTSISKDVAEEI